MYRNIYLIAIVVTFSASIARADVFRCVAADGRTSFSNENSGEGCVLLSGKKSFDQLHWVTLSKRWHLVATSSDLDTYHIDNDSIQRTPKYVAAWVHKESASFGPDSPSYSLIRYRVACQGKMLGVEIRADYGQDSKVRSTKSFVDASGVVELTPAFPESIGEDLVSYMCDRAKAGGK